MSYYEAVVIGSGISGLSAAYTLKQKGINVCVLDSNERPGGLIQSVKEEGFLMENGPNTIPGRATDFLALCKSLNMDLLPTHSQASNRYIYLKNRLQALPSKPEQALTTNLLSWRGKRRVLEELWVPPFEETRKAADLTPEADITVSDFFRTRFGDEVADYLVDPFVGGIYAGDIHKLSMPSIFPSIWDMQAEYGSVLKAAFFKFRNAYREKQDEKKRLAKEAKKMGIPVEMLKRPSGPSPRDLLSLKQGLQYLPLTLARLVGNVQQGVTVKAIRKEKADYALTLDDGSEIWAGHLILAVPAYVAGPLLKSIAPLASDELATIPYVSLSVAHTAFERNQIPHALDGFGMLIPSRERMSLLGSIWASSLFPERTVQRELRDECVLLSNYLGGARKPGLTFEEPETILDAALHDLSYAFKTVDRLVPIFNRVIQHERAIPQYTVGHRTRWSNVDWYLGNHPNLALCGNYLTGVALNDCVKTGIAAANRVLGN